MRILPLSDLHREIYPSRALGIDLSACRPDVVVLAGDIDKSSHAVEWAAETFKDIPVLYVAGNHEFYGSNIDTVPARIHDACRETDNVFFLNGACKIIDGVRFLGATLWTDFCLFGLWRRPMAMMAAKEFMSDYHSIRVANNGYRKLMPADTGTQHAVTRAWMQSELEQPFKGKTVVITHMAPSKRSIPERYAERRLRF
ncbi:MAG: metallophosphoesterase [Pseudomonadota bacterium]